MNMLKNILKIFKHKHQWKVIGVDRFPCIVAYCERCNRFGSIYNTTFEEYMKAYRWFERKPFDYQGDYNNVVLDR